MKIYCDFKHIILDLITVILDSSSMNEIKYFLHPSTVAQKQYEALRAYFVEKLSATEVSSEFGYTFRAFTSLVADFRRKQNKQSEDQFFKINKTGRKIRENKNRLIMCFKLLS